ncbi:MAG: hypothetical protein IKV94_05005 [Clostridia bacterium]|nr:hypothetical protein [Clostridia bacterium]
MRIFQYESSYYVNGVNCINVYGFKSSDLKSKITSTWNNWNRLFINNNRVGNPFTGF